MEGVCLEVVRWEGLVGRERGGGGGHICGWGVGGWLGGWKLDDGWMDGCMGGGMDGRLDGWRVEVRWWMGECMYRGWLDDWLENGCCDLISWRLNGDVDMDMDIRADLRFWRSGGGKGWGGVVCSGV